LKFVKELNSTLLGVWLGAALFFSAVVAPAVFLVLRGSDAANPNQIAGSIVTRTLGVINLGGFVIGLLALLTLLIAPQTKRGIAFILEALSLVLMTVATGVGHWIVAARLVALRTSLLVPIDQAAWNDPRRVAFNHLHQYSVMLLSLAMIAAIVAIIVGRCRARE
jgi:formate/nitrite transporter FocA (FNT family)